MSIWRADSRRSGFNVIRLLFFLSLGIFLFSLVVNLETIRTFPSWFDEALFANLAFNLAKGNGLILDIIPGYAQGEINIYGPIYFYIHSFLINSIGLNSFIFRLPNLLAGYLSIWLLFKVLRHNNVDWNLCVLFAIALAVDVSFNRNLVSGRMDLLAVMFISLALYVASKQSSKEGGHSAVRGLLIGGLASLAYLTTPRALFLLPVVFVMALQTFFFNRSNLASRNNWIFVLLIIVPFIVPVWLWVLHVGGIHAYVSMFTTNGVAGHIAPSIFRSSYDNIAIVLMIILCAFNLRQVLKSEILIGLVSTFIAFSIFVKEVGPYAGMIMPFVLATIVLLISKSKLNTMYQYVVMILIILPGLLLIALRGADMYMNSECRDHDKIATIVDSHAHPGLRVVAPFKYYFLFERTDRDLVSLEFSKIDPRLVVSDADFLAAAGDLPDWQKKMGFHEVAQLACVPHRVPLLPETYYKRSLFNEAFYRKQGDEGRIDVH